MDKDEYRVLHEKDVEELAVEVGKRVQDWHKFKPNYVFLNDTGAIPLGYSFKEAWKKAFPNEPVPKFYRIDPRALQDTSRRQNSSYVEGLANFVGKRIKKKNARVIVFDEESHSGGSSNSVRDFLVEYSGIGRDKIKIDNGEIGRFSYLGSMKGSGGRDFEGARPTIKDAKKLRGKIANPKNGQMIIDWKGYVEQEKISINIRDYIHDMKLLGRQAGEELRQEIQQRQDLEGKVTSSIAIGGLTLSIIFLSPSLTGNTISTMTNQNSNLIGVGLFVIGLIGTFFRFRKK